MRRPPATSEVLVVGLFAGLVAAFSLSGRAYADEPPPTTDELVTPSNVMTFKQSGYLRLRGDYILRPDLGVGVGGFASRARLLKGNALLADETTDVTSGNMRFRWSPELTIGQRVRIGMTIEVFDNLVLGSTPDFSPGRADAPFPAWSDGQAPGDTGFGFSDFIRIKALWGEWDVVHALVLRGGRMPDHWGLGMLHHGGECVDCDFGDSVDRVSALARAFGFTSLWFFDFPSEGTIARKPADPFGPGTDATQLDDVIRWGFTFGQQPYDANDLAARAKKLATGKVVVDWGFRNTFISQKLSSDPGLAKTDRCKALATTAATLDPAPVAVEPEFDCTQLQRRESDLWIGDAWVKVEWRPKYNLGVRIELELAAEVGKTLFTQNLTDTDSKKDFVAFGGVLQAEVKHDKMAYLFEFGFATSDEIAMGPNAQPWHSVNDGNYAADARRRANGTVSQFLFNRDYRVDLLLFRQVIGTVAGAIYLKPTVRGALIQGSDAELGLEGSLLYGHALDAQSTPGQAAPLGLEADLKLYYDMKEGARADLEMGLLVPFDGLRNGPGGPKPDVAFTIRGRLLLRF